MPCCRLPLSPSNSGYLLWSLLMSTFGMSGAGGFPDGTKSGTGSSLIPEGAGPCQWVVLTEFCQGVGVRDWPLLLPDSCHVRGERAGRGKDRAGARPLGAPGASLGGPARGPGDGGAGN